VPWFPRFLFLFAWGCLGAAQLAPAAQIGHYFHRFMAGVALLMCAAALAVVRAPDGLLIGATLVAAASWIACRPALEIRRLRLLARLGWAGLAVGYGLELPWRDGWPIALGRLAQGLASGAFLGASLTAMITGHFYLNNARLPFEILIRMCRAVVVSGALAVGIGLALFWTGPVSVQELKQMFERGNVLDPLLPLVRVLAGGLFALVLALMALSCAKHRANQSATGILYALVGVVLIGEMSSHYLTHVAGIGI
jgi:hypothetical protein